MRYLPPHSTLLRCQSFAALLSAAPLPGARPAPPQQLLLVDIHEYAYLPLSATTTASTAFTSDHTHCHGNLDQRHDPPSPPPATTAPTPLVQVRRPGGDARRDEALDQPETGVRLRDGHGHLLRVGLRALSQDGATAPSSHRPLPCGTPCNTVPTSDGRCSTLCRCSSRS